MSKKTKRQIKRHSNWLNAQQDRITRLYGRMTGVEGTVGILQRQMRSVENECARLANRLERAEQTPPDVFEAKVVAAAGGSLFLHDGDAVTVRRFPSGHAVVVQVP